MKVRTDSGGEANPLIQFLDDDGDFVKKITLDGHYAFYQAASILFSPSQLDRLAISDITAKVSNKRLEAFWEYYNSPEYPWKKV